MNINLKNNLNELDNVGKRLQKLIYEFTNNPKKFGGWTQYADAVNIPRSTFQNYKDNKRIPTIEHLTRICAFSNRSPDWLLYGRDVSKIVKESSCIILIPSKKFNIRGNKYTLKQLIEYAKEILESNHDNADSLARNILSFLDPVRESQDKETSKKTIKKKHIVI